MDLQELNKKKTDAESAINTIILDLFSGIEVDRCIVNVDITRECGAFEIGDINVKTKIRIVL